MLELSPYYLPTETVLNYCAGKRYVWVLGGYDSIKLYTNLDNIFGPSFWLLFNSLFWFNNSLDSQQSNFTGRRAFWFVSFNNDCENRSEGPDRSQDDRTASNNSTYRFRQLGTRRIRAIIHTLTRSVEFVHHIIANKATGLCTEVWK